MKLARDTFCSFCGAAYPAPQAPDGYPRTCSVCGTTVWANPVPVSVVLVPVLRGAYVGLLVVRRGIEPAIGKLAFPGGFVEPHETWAEGGAREVREETGVTVAAAELTPFWFASTQPRPDRILLFSLARPLDAKALGPARLDAETQERGLIVGPGGLDAVFAFPRHVEAAQKFFTERRVSRSHAYQRI